MNNENNTKLAKDKLEFVSSIITNKEGNVLLLKRLDTLKLDPGKYDLCSGHMKTMEVPMQSMIRELKEETGICIEQIKRMEKLGDIPVPHEKFLDKMCHMYYIEIDISEKDLNRMIKEVEEPEMQKAKYVKDINELRKIQKSTDLMRTIYTEDMEKIFGIVEKKINERKELGKNICKEER